METRIQILAGEKKNKWAVELDQKVTDFLAQAKQDTSTLDRKEFYPEMLREILRRVFNSRVYWADIPVSRRIEVPGCPDLSFNDITAYIPFEITQAEFTRPEYVHASDLRVFLKNLDDKIDPRELAKHYTNPSRDILPKDVTSHLEPDFYFDSGMQQSVWYLRAYMAEEGWPHLMEDFGVNPHDPNVQEAFKGKDIIPGKPLIGKRLTGVVLDSSPEYRDERKHVFCFLPLENISSPDYLTKVENSISQ